MKFSVHIPFVELLGFELVSFGDGLAEIAFTGKEEHSNSFGVVHGGATMTLLDVVMAHAARSGHPDGSVDTGVVTIEMKTSFMQASRGVLLAKGRLMHRTATMAFTEGTVFDADGRVCSHATGTFKYVKRLAVGRDVASLNVISTD
jgi:uncharacterized protein (TIGR00369 family)